MKISHRFGWAALALGLALSGVSHAILRASAGGGGSSSPGFDTITSGTNTGAAMVVGTGASLAASGSGTITATAVPVGGITGLGTGIATALAINVGTAGAPVVLNGAGGTPSAIVLTNGTGLPFSSLTSATNTAAAMVVGSGASLTYTGTGTINATTVGGNSLPTLSAGTIGGILYWDNVTGAGNINRSAALTALVLGNGTSAPSAYGGATCTNQFVRALSAVGAATCNSVAIATDVSGLGTSVATALAVNVGSAGGLTPYTFTTGTSRTIAVMAEIIVCTSTCTITPPGTLVAGSQFCVQNDDNVSTVITLAAVTAVQYEATARTSYGTANHTKTSGGAVGDQICMVAVSTTKYNVFSYSGTWTNN